MNDKNVGDIASFVPALLLTIGKNLWEEVMDENYDFMEQLVWDGDDGIDNVFGVYIKHPGATFCEYFRSVTGCDKNGDEEERCEVTPCQAALRRKAAEN